MSKRGMRRTMIGVVVSNKMDKTVVVRVERLVQDPEYKKYVRRYSKFMAHDEANACDIGDRSGSSSTGPFEAQALEGAGDALEAARSERTGAIHDPDRNRYSKSPTTRARARSRASACSAARGAATPRWAT